MMIVINARFLTQKITGVQRFAIEISKELKKTNLSIVFLAPKDIIHYQIADELGVKTLGNLKGHLWEQIELQAFVYYKKAMLISFCNTAPLFLNNQIVTIHDLCFKKHPEWFSKIFVNVYNFMIPRLVKRAMHILTVSETSKVELIQELNVSQRKVSVIYNAVASVFREELSSNISVFEDDEEYILTVSSHHPRKNFDRLIQGFQLINDDNLKLYIIGDVNKNFTKMNLNNDIKDRVIFLKNISDRQLVHYYRNAKLFVYPSLYEGFGIPIIEAMSQDIPVCVSDIPVFHEVCNNDAVYFDPFNPHDIKDKMMKVLEGNNNAKKINLDRFSWNKGAIKIESIIHSFKSI